MAPKPDRKHLESAEEVFRHLTDKAGQHGDPQDHLHTHGDHEKAQSLFRSAFPYDTLKDFESQWHLGNYVIDRDTGQKTFEPMSVYVRLGMHLLYYGSEQEHVLESKHAKAMLEEQSLKMGKQYDSPESRDHIQPFIESFELQDTLPELVSLPDLKCVETTCNRHFYQRFQTTITDKV